MKRQHANEDIAEEASHDEHIVLLQHNSFHALNASSLQMAQKKLPLPAFGKIEVGWEL
jgi:hypothetical protein